MDAILIASRNTHKVREFSEMLGVPVQTLADFPEIPDVVEDGTTFEANARKKAVEISLQFPGKLVLADDSGLEVDVLDGRPGVYSARYAANEPAREGESLDERNLRKVLEELENEANRGAQYRCVLVLAKDGKVLQTSEGVCRGTLIREPRGANGFGYDPAFVPDGYEQTFGELSSEVKHSFSHRAKALEILKRDVVG